MQIRLDRDELDESCFAAVQDVMENVSGMTTRQRLTVTLNITNALLARVDLLLKDTEKSANASKAAKKRWAGTKSQRGDPAAATEPPRRRHRAATPTGEPPAQPPTVSLDPLPPADTTVAPTPFGTRESERI